jgi:hypothetical protein
MNAPSMSHPVFVLGLDAVDEAFREHDQRALRKLLMWFWKQEEELRQQPRATLIVTCRDPKELAERWLSLTSPYEDEPKPFRGVEVMVDEFSPSELVAAARLHLPALAERFEHAYRALEGQGTLLASSLETASVLQPESPSLRSVETEVFQALRHPTLWHCLLKVDVTMHSRVLDGEMDALAHLVMHFLSWFCHKVRARGKPAHNGEIIEVLKAIAFHCDPRRSPRHPSKDWKAHASKTAYMNREQAELFYEEALSAGLIVRDTGGWWRWRHPCVGEYLAVQSSNLEEE